MRRLGRNEKAGGLERLRRLRRLGGLGGMRGWKVGRAVKNVRIRKAEGARGISCG
ncbi:hypothetical protein [Capnocytophaga leadbetteri]|uniref:hypothetical protein n=1 Tax=Capnocytophaga leadbetteri TaxID=327575 RepID=UPI0028EE3824|nr:hypothetical protein [Capnocytophaga leadbetteri]